MRMFLASLLGILLGASRLATGRRPQATPPLACAPLDVGEVSCLTERGSRTEQAEVMCVTAALDLHEEAGGGGVRAVKHSVENVQFGSGPASNASVRRPCVVVVVRGCSRFTSPFPTLSADSDLKKAALTQQHSSPCNTDTPRSPLDMISRPLDSI